MRRWSLFVIIMLAGLFLRLEHIGRPIWIDETHYWRLLTGEIELEQEFIPVALGHLFGGPSQNPIILRLPFLFCSMAAIGACWLLPWRLELRLTLSIIVATAPWFTFWGVMARPYAVAWPFMILAWRWPVALWPAVFSTPLAVVAVPVWRIGKRFPDTLAIAMGAAMAAGGLTLRPDIQGQRDFLNPEFMAHAARIHTLVILAALLHLGQLANTHIVRQRVRRLCQRLVRQARRLEH